VITEKYFSISQAAFWRQLLPMESHFIRVCNNSTKRFCPALVSTIPASQRGIVNEVGFRIFAGGLTSIEASAVSIDACVQAAFLHVSRLRQLPRTRIRMPNDAELREAIEIAKRLDDYFASAGADSLLNFPVFVGCGWIESCEGDTLYRNMLIEVKAGDRRFRSIDLRQLLCYCALNFASKSYDIERVCLLNPRRGLYYAETVENLCHRLSARSAVDVLSEIVEYVSTAYGQYGS
jgi:hypothetical protein